MYHPACAARVLAETMPPLHGDIFRSISFWALVSAFVPVKFFDYRPTEISLSGPDFKRADLLILPFGSGSLSLLSCMHVVEHVSLGRYGGPLDPDGDFEAIGQLARVLGRGGSLLFVVPTDRPRVLFNSERISPYQQGRTAFQSLQLVRSPWYLTGPQMANWSSTQQ